MTDQTTDEAVVEPVVLARRIASDALLRREKMKPGIKAGIHAEIMAGKHDDEAIVLGPLMALIVERQRTERAEKLLADIRNKLDTERYKVAYCLQEMRKAIDRRRWLSEPGRGSYTYDDERYQQEFGEALNELNAALDPMRKIASDWSDCPTDPLLIAGNRAAALATLRAPSTGEQA